MRKVAGFLLEYGLLIIITIPAFISLINPYFFSMHDSQQVARLFVLTEALKQGSIYPRWVDLFGFNYGYPLFNFYPPLIYYLGALFHALGFSLLWSVKMVFISGYVLAALGMYLFVKKLLNGRRAPAYLSAVLYTFFTYHAINAYVRGAMAEFFSMTVLPFVFLALESLRQKNSLKNALFFSVMFALLILTHPLIAFPAVLFIGAYMLHSLVLYSTKAGKLKYLLHAIIGTLGGLLLSAFFWLPSMLERKYTLVDSILLKELANYTIHFVYPDQLWFSPWGYGGSGPGYSDGMSFQIGKIHIAVALFALAACLVAFFFKSKNKLKTDIKHSFRDFVFFFVFMIFAIFMMIPASRFVWDNVTFLHYLQFPWRFMTFVGLLLSVVGAYGIYFTSLSSQRMLGSRSWIPKQVRNDYISIILVVILSVLTVFTYKKYFQPQDYLKVTDKDLTSFDEIAWRVSRTSFEFVPKGVKTKKSDLGTTILAIDNDHVGINKYQLTNGTANVSDVDTKYSDKRFNINVFDNSVDFRLNTYNFPGWAAYIDGQKTTIKDNNDFKLITITVPRGQHTLRFVFEDTPVRAIADWISIASAIAIAVYLVIPIKKTSKKKK